MAANSSPNARLSSVAGVRSAAATTTASRRRRKGAICLRRASRLLANESTEIGTHVLATRTGTRLTAAAPRPSRLLGPCVCTLLAEPRLATAARRAAARIAADEPDQTAADAFERTAR